MVGRKPSTLFELRNLYNAAAALARHGTCWLCAGTSGERALCAPCLADLPRALGTDVPVVRGVTHLCAPFAYRYPLDALIRAAKFSRDLGAAGALMDCFSEAVSIHLHDYDRILPVPLAPLRYAVRGYNLALWLASSLTRSTRVRVDARGLSRRRGGPPQSRLSVGARAANVRGAFTAQGACTGQTLLVVDDVVTTGATLGAIAVALRAAGAARVDAVALAAAPLAGRAGDALRYRGSSP